MGDQACDGFFFAQPAGPESPERYRGLHNENGGLRGFILKAHRRVIVEQL